MTMPKPEDLGDGSVRCNRCHLRYRRDDAERAALHAGYHRRFLKCDYPAPLQEEDSRRLIEDGLRHAVGGAGLAARIAGAAAWVHGSFHLHLFEGLLHKRGRECTKTGYFTRYLRRSPE